MNPSYPQQYYVIDTNTPVAKEAKGKPIFSEADTLPHISWMHVKKLICDDDDRELVDAANYPNKVICRLLINDQNGQQHLGTGFLISPTCVMTSGHCVFLQSGWAESIVVIPGANGASAPAPFGRMIGGKFVSVDGWTKYKDQNFDYGAVILHKHQSYSGFSDFLAYDHIDNKAAISNYGYSDESPKKHEQWGSQGRITGMTDHLFYYDNDTFRGNSGSPMILEEDTVVAIHSYGQCPNFGIRITPKVKEIMNTWKDMDASDQIT